MVLAGPCAVREDPLYTSPLSSALEAKKNNSKLQDHAIAFWVFRWRSVSRCLARRAAAVLLACRVFTTAEAQALSEDYLIGPGDRLAIIVLNEPELSMEVTVRPDGRLSSPLIQDLLVSGRSARDITAKIGSRLGKYLRNPQVTVIVREAVGTLSQQIRIVGAVVQPQAVAFRSGITLLDVMKTVGGLSPFADGNDAIVLRQEHGRTKQIPVRIADLMEDGDISANVAMMPRDVLVIPEGFFSGNLSLLPSIEFRGEYSDNIDLKPSGEEESAFIMRVIPRLRVRADLARVKAALDGTLDTFYQTGGDLKGANLRGKLTGTSTTEVVSDLLFFDLRAAIDQEILNNRNPSSESDEETVQRYLISPYVRNHLGKFADTEIRYMGSHVVTGSDNGDDTSNGARFAVSSGQAFPTLLWDVDAIIVDQDGEGDDVSRRRMGLGIEYLVDRSFSPLASAGYEKFDDQDLDFEGPTWHAGFRWRPGKRMELLATYGRRDDEDSLAVNLQYKIGPRLPLVASYVEMLETLEERLMRNLGFIGIDEETSALIDTRTQLPFTPRTSPFSVQDSTTRIKWFRATLPLEWGVNSFALVADIGEQETVATGETEKVKSVLASWTRQLSARMTLNLTGDYKNIDFSGENRKDDRYAISGTISYRILENLEGTLSYRLRQNSSNDDEAEYTENGVALGIRINF